MLYISSTLHFSPHSLISLCMNQDFEININPQESVSEQMQPRSTCSPARLLASAAVWGVVCRAIKGLAAIWSVITELNKCVKLHHVHFGG